jgi:hypothetical protein
LLELSDASMKSTFCLRRTCLGSVQDEDRRRDSGSVEEVRREPDDGFDQVLLEQALADVSFDAPRNSTPCGMTTPTMPVSFVVATMCCTKAKVALGLRRDPKRKRP